MVKKCQFSSDLDDSFNLDLNENFMSVDIEDQVFNQNTKPKKISFKNWKIVVAIAVPIVIILIIIIIIIVIKRRNPNAMKEYEMASLTHDLFTNDFN